MGGKLLVAWMVVSAITIAALLFVADLPILYSLGGTWAIVAFNALLFKRIRENGPGTRDAKGAPVVARRQYALRGPSPLVVEVPVTGRGPAEIAFWLLGRHNGSYGVTARGADGAEIERVVLADRDPPRAKVATLYPDNAGPGARLVVPAAPDAEWSVTLVATIETGEILPVRDLMKLEARSRTEIYVPLAPARRRDRAAA
jgi:hypothetical protein